MTRLLILVEGQSEEIFVKQTLSAHLAQFGVYVQPIVLWTKRLPSGGGFRGGVSTWQAIHKNLSTLMKDSNAWVTTLLDFYGLPKNFPGLSDALQCAHPAQAVVALQERFFHEMGHSRFIPFFALHEFEAWLFSAPDVVEAHFGKSKMAKEGLAQALRQVVHQVGAPELINHGPATHPKARLQKLIGTYKETSDGPIVLQKIGITAVRCACPHFDAWVKRLEALGAAAA